MLISLQEWNGTKEELNELLENLKTMIPPNEAMRFEVGNKRYNIEVNTPLIPIIEDIMEE